MMRRRVFLMILLVCTACLVYANKEYRQIRTYIKKGGNAQQIMKIVQQCEKDEDTKDDPELYFLAAQVQRKINDGENLKLYTKQNYDTATFFSSIKSMFDYCILCDKKDMMPDANGKVKISYRTKSYYMLKSYYPNLYNAGLFYIKKKDYKNAEPYFDMFINVRNTPVFAKDKKEEYDSKMPRAAFWSMTSCYALQDYKGVFKFDSLAARDSANMDLYLQYRSLAYAGLKDSVKYEKELWKGLHRIPTDYFFFTHLTDYYNMEKQYAKALTLSDSMIKIYPKQPIFMFAKSAVLYNMKDYDNCIQAAKQVVAVDTVNAEAYYYIGSSYFIKATDIDDNASPNINSSAYKKQKKEANDLFAAALPYLERYRKLAPKETNRWAPLLYRTYLSLNKAKEFAEIEKVLSQTDAEKTKK